MQLSDFFNGFQSTLPRGSDEIGGSFERKTAISIHAPLRERLPTGVANLEVRAISIHAPLRERRVACGPAGGQQYHFNPRSLTGATYNNQLSNVAKADFNPRSLTGATKGVFRNIASRFISIHAPLRERLQKELQE